MELVYLWVKEDSYMRENINKSSLFNIGNLELKLGSGLDKGVHYNDRGKK